MHCQTSSEEAMVIGPTCGVVLITTGNTRDIKSASSTFGKHQLGRLPRAWTRRRGWTRGDAGGWLPRFKMPAGGRVGPDRIHSYSPPLSSDLNSPSLASRSPTLRLRCVQVCVCSFPCPFFSSLGGQEKTRPETRDFYTPGSSRRRTAPANECTGSAILSVPVEKSGNVVERGPGGGEAWWVLCGEQGGARLGRQRPRGCE